MRCARFTRSWSLLCRFDRAPIARLLQVLLLVLISATAGRAESAQIASVSVLDRDYLVVHVLDGEVIHENPDETISRYAPELNTSAAVQTGSWTLRSTEDTNYGAAGQQPLSCFRKTKLSGHAQMEWVSSDYRYEYTYQHWIYLRLPQSLQQGMTYTLEIAPAINGDLGSESFTFDVFSTRSEAVHVNLVGYAPDAPHKAADLYHWMGDGGARDYSAFEGNTVYLHDVAGGQSYPVGQVAFWRSSGNDLAGYNLARSDVWNADFSAFTDPGTYRLVIDGVGCSQDFVISAGAYADPFKVSIRGFFYMRIGQDNAAGLVPAPRTPLYIPDTSPTTTKVYLTEMQPWHSQWSSFSGGDVWDNPDAWAPFRKAGNPTNPNAWGGHSDAADWDRHLGHVSSIYDMLLPFILTGGAIGDDDAGIAESGNGIPDLLDEARNEVDFWLRLRDGDGYSHGLTNPNGNNEFFQAGPTAMAAWANAANSAMLADALRLAGQTSLRDQYQSSAVTAYNHANGLSDPMLDATQDLGDGAIRGRDLKLMAAAFLYNLTGDEAYEAVIQNESVCAGGVAALNDGSRNQIWATAAYLLTPQTIHYPTLWDNMKAAVISQARSEETNHIDQRPTRRATDERPGYFRTAQNVHRTLIAHAVTDDPTERALLHKALALEADWGLGRNPLNMIEMTTAFTPLASKRSPQYIYAAGRSDGVAGVPPGQTPYLNLDDWAPGMTMGTPSRLYENSYPGDFRNTWPVAEAYFDTPWVWAYSEFTPQQTMRGKMALYGYLHGLATTSNPPDGTGGTGGTGGAAGAAGSGGTGGITTGCTAPLTECGSVCVDIDTDPANCGACGTICTPTEVCSLAACTPAATCSAPLVLCDGVCVDTASNALHCGGCGAACPAAEVCSTGACSASGCGADLSQCEQSCVDLTSDLLSCGDCGTACLVGQICSESQCSGTPTGGDPTVPVGGCATGLVACGQACVDLSSDILSCGACDTSCLLGQTCSGGQCEGTPTGGDPTQPVVPSTSDEGNGCGCATPGGSGSPRSVLVAWLAVVMLLRQRRRRGESR